jgi:uncharacterized membrane-anchored protein
MHSRALAESNDALAQQRQVAFKAAEAALVTGPADIKLGAVATLHLPAGLGFVPKKEASEVARLFGNTPSDQFLGWVLPLGDTGGQWRGWLEYDDAGHVAEDDAKDWKANELLKSIQEGTEAANEEREKVGEPAIAVTRWIEAPQYDATNHRLVWSAEVTRKVPKSDDRPSANYNTYVLGRVGYISLDFVTDEAGIEARKPIARDLLSRIEFNDGQRYGQFNASTDKVAAFGLAALVAGVAAKKLGLLAVLTAFLIKFAKVAVIAVIAFWKRIKSFLARLVGKAPPVEEAPITIGTPSTRPAAPEASPESSPNSDVPPPGA